MSVPFMQFYVADYLGDTRHLTTEQHGAYLLLLMTMWRADGKLPNDPKRLARIVGCTASRWARIADEVLAFFDVEDGFLSNKRLKLELEKASEKSNQRAVSGSLGGKAKALKDKGSPVANATVLPCHSSESEPYKNITTNVVIAPSKNTRAKTFRFVPDDWKPGETHGETAKAEGMDREAYVYQVQRFREHEFKKPVQNLDLAFHRWIRTAKEFKRHDKSDKTTQRHDNYAASWAGADGAAALLAARRNL